jgi:hypothetical protein
MKASLKITCKEGKHASFFMIRCWFLEKLLDLLEEEGIVGDARNQHDVIGLFLHECLDPGEQFVINKHADDGTEIDVILRRKKAEIKTRRNIDSSGLPDFIGYFYDEMTSEQGEKEAWWLVYFMQRSDGKDKIGEICINYLTAIEIPALALDDIDEKTIIAEVLAMSRSVEKKVRKEDKLDDVILLPVDNIVPMDRLRKKARKYQQERDEAQQKRSQAEQERDEERQKRSQAEQERDEVEQERDNALRKIKELQDELDNLNSDR